MAKCVRSNATPAKARSGLCGESGVLRDEVGNSVARQWGTPGVTEDLGNRGDVGVVALHQGAESLCRLGPQGARPVLSSLSMESNLSRAPQVQVPAPEGQGLTDSGTRVVEEEEKSEVACTAGGRRIRLGDQSTGLLWFQIGRSADLRTLGGDREDPAVLLSSRQVMAEKVRHEATDGGEPAVARGRTVPTCRFDVIQESQDHLGSDVVQMKFGDGPTQVLSREQKEEAKRVAVGTHGVIAGAADGAQMTLEEGLHQGEQ